MHLENSVSNTYTASNQDSKYSINTQFNQEIYTKLSDYDTFDIKDYIEDNIDEPTKDKIKGQICKYVHSMYNPACICIPKIGDCICNYDTQDTSTKSVYDTNNFLINLFSSLNTNKIIILTILCLTGIVLKATLFARTLFLQKLKINNLEKNLEKEKAVNKIIITKQVLEENVNALYYEQIVPVTKEGFSILDEDYIKDLKEDIEKLEGLVKKQEKEYKQTYGEKYEENIKATEEAIDVFLNF